MKRPLALSSPPALAACALLFASGCGEADREAPELVLPPARPIPFGRVEPVLYLSGHSFQEELRTLRPLHARHGDRVEFIPGVTTGSLSTARLELSSVREDGSVRSLWKGAPVAHQTMEQEVRETALASRVLLELPPGPQVLRWVLHDAEPGVDGLVLLPRLLPRAPMERPSILLVCSDTHRADHALGARGRELMPRLAEFADQGVVYARAYSTASWTLPSIASTLSGVFPRRHRTGERVDVARVPRDELGRPEVGLLPFVFAGEEVVLNAYPGALPTLFERLQEVGYRTGMVLSNPFYFSADLFSEGTDVVYRAGVSPGEQVGAAAHSFLRLFAADQPVCLLVHYMDVHHWQPWYDPDEQLEPRVAYAQAVRASDRYFGELLEAWDGRFDPARGLALFFSDHGEALGDVEEAFGHGNSVGDEVLHVPLVVRYPASCAQEPAIRFESVGLIDILPTVLQVAGAGPVSASFDGSSLLGAPPGPGRPLFTDYQLFGDEVSTVRRGNEMLIVNCTSGERSLEGTLDGAPLEALYSRYVEESEARSASLHSESTVDHEAFKAAMEALGYAGQDR